ncbi:hypothetical protein AD998_16280 [bacterium 336/3]|nr:hypothetical protein AD998_16280 [bacterium 336/3]
MFSRKIYFLTLAGMMSLVACKKTDLVPNTSQNQSITLQALSVNQLNEVIKKQLTSTHQSFDWNKASDDELWSGIKNSQDGNLLVGYKPSNISITQANDLVVKGDIQSSAWKDAHNQIIQLILETERQLNPEIKIEDIISFDNEAYAVFSAKVNNPAVIRKIRMSPFYKYAESTYEPKAEADINSRNPSGQEVGCAGGYQANPDIRLGMHYDKINTTSQSLMSWNYKYHKIKDAWATAFTGKGIGVMVFDTGLNPNQSLLVSKFNSGLITGRTRGNVSFLKNSAGTLLPSADECGHGTSLSGVVGAPRIDNLASTAGVAYGCNLLVARVTYDVYIDSAEEINAVAAGFDAFAQNNSMRIASMSLGRVGNNTLIANAIQRAYNTGRKLIFVASGTAPFLVSGSGSAVGQDELVFPANMGTPTIAVSGIATDYLRCEQCVVGNQTDFVVVMEKVLAGTAEVKVHPLGTANSSSTQPNNIGGSSVATATMAGMAAIVWSKFPNESAISIFFRLQKAADKYRNGISKPNPYGWGIVDVSKALTQPL